MAFIIFLLFVILATTVVFFWALHELRKQKAQRKEQ